MAIRNLRYEGDDILNKKSRKIETIDEKLQTLIDDFSAMVNDEDGHAHIAKIEGYNIAAKTGTAEIKSSQDDNNGTENGWFVAVDTTSSKLSIAVIIEDVKNRGGSSIPIPMVKNIMEEYLTR